jgi:hypothetical protein
MLSLQGNNSNVSSQWDFRLGGTNSNITTYNAQRLRINYNGTEAATIDNLGNFGVGRSNPQYKMDVNGTVNATAYTGATITGLSNMGLFNSNTAVWSSNNLFPSSGGTITGTTRVGSFNTQDDPCTSNDGRTAASGSNGASMLHTSLSTATITVVHTGNKSRQLHGGYRCSLGLMVRLCI